MSLAVADLREVYQKIDPILDVNHPQSYAIPTGSQNFTLTRFISDNFSSNGATFNVIVPSKSTIVNKKIYLRFTFSFSFANATGKSLLNIGATDAGRCLPLNRACQNINVSINGKQVSASTWQYTDIFSRVQEDELLALRDWSGSFAYPDQTQAYSDCIGGNRNPLGSYNDSVVWGGELRGDPLRYTSVIAANVETITFEVIEPVWVSPLAFSHRDQKGFLGVDQIDITVSFVNDLFNALWSRDIINAPGGDLPAVTVNALPVPPEVLVNFCTPQETMDLPSACSYPYYETKVYKSTVGAVNPATAFQATSNNISFSTIPEKLYIYARRSDATRTYRLPDTYAEINSVSLNFNNQDGLLSNAREYQLYDMSRRNGLEMTWSQWQRHTGSILCLDVAQNCSLGPLSAPGSSAMNWNFSCVVNCTSRYAVAANFELFVIAMFPGICTVSSGSAVLNVGVVTEKDILDSKLIRCCADMDDVDNKMYGGDLKSFVAKAKAAASKAYDLGKKAAPYVKKGIQIGKEVAPLLAPLLGLGMSEDEAMNYLEGNGYVGGKRGKGFTGGAKASKSGIQRRLM